MEGYKPNLAKEQPEETEDIDEGLGVLIKKKTLYHGSGTGGINKFNAAEEDTIGNGAYFTAEAKDAIGYARRRARPRENAIPVIYETSIENLKLLDLRKEENAKRILEGFKRILEQKLEELSSDEKDGRRRAGVYQRAIDAIETGTATSRNLRAVTFSTGRSFTDYVKSLGYEGLIALEGGEGSDIGNHDSYVIFDPEKAKVVREQAVED